MLLIVVQIPLLGISDQNLRLLRQARHMRKTCCPTTGAPAHEALLRFPVEGLGADVARLALGVVGARLGLFSADGLFAPTEEPDFEFDGDGELDELTSADFGEDPYLHVDT